QLTYAVVQLASYPSALIVLYLQQTNGQLAQALVSVAQLNGALLYALFELMVGFFQGLLSPVAVGDVKRLASQQPSAFAIDYRKLYRQPNVFPVSLQRA